MQQLWYVAYGTNMSSARFRVYLEGGTPLGGARVYPGARDPVAPQRDVSVLIPGGIRFVGVSSVWGGGMAIFDPGADGEIAARAYLITAEQFVDVLAQETRAAPGLDVDLTPVHETGWHSLGQGRYQTLALLGERDGHPMLTFTSADADAHTLNRPSENYLRTTVFGLREAHGWAGPRIGAYLCRFPGAAGVWTAQAIEDLVGEPPGQYV
jgi:hypothetical protein